MTVEALCTDLGCFGDWLYRWQSFAGAAIAIPFAAAAIAFPTILELERRKRRFIALKATMPLMLSAVANYAQAATKALAACRTTTGVNLVAVGHFQKPQIPKGLVGSLEAIIEALPNKIVVNRLANMIGEMQVLDSRMNELPASAHQGSYFDSMLMQTGTIHAQASSLFGFARSNRMPEKRLRWADVAIGLHVAQVREGDHPGVFAFIGRFTERGIGPEDRSLEEPTTFLGRRMAWIKAVVVGWWAEITAWWKRRRS